MTIKDPREDPSAPIAVTPGAGLLPPVYLGQPTDLLSLLWRAIRWSLRGAGLPGAQEEGRND